MFLLFGDNDSCVVIMQWKDYDMELQNMIDDEIREVIYSPTTLRDLKKFQDLLRRNYDRYEDMRPISKQPGKIYAAAKAINLIHWRISQLKKFRLRFHFVNAAKVPSNYMKPYCQNEHKFSVHSFTLQDMSNTLWIPYSLPFLCKKTMTI